MVASARALALCPLRSAGRMTTMTTRCSAEPRPLRVVLWLRTDLRTRDNAALQAARALPHACVLPVYVVQSDAPCRLLRDTPRCGPHRARFLAAALADLRARLRRAGSGLAVLHGAPDEAIAALRPDLVITQAEPCVEERGAEARLGAALRAAGAALRTLPVDTLFAREALPFGGDLREMPNSGVTFLKRALAAGCAPAPPQADAAAAGPRLGAAWEGLPALDAPPFGSGALSEGVGEPGGEPGGETAALDALDALLWRGDAVRSYAVTRNALRGGTGLSAHLALGCLSVRTMAAALARYDAERPGAEDATGWAPGGLRFELGVRDYFRYSALRWGAALFAEQGPVPAEPPRSWLGDGGALQAWRDGATGVPLVDAIQRQLRAEGHVSNRARQITASWAVLARGLDWRRCAEHFEATLRDFDPSNNAGNWLSVAGLSGGRENWFNVALQAAKYDADGAYVRAYVPELAALPNEAIHAPWTLSEQALADAGVVLGRTYPKAELHMLRAPPPRKR